MKLGYARISKADGSHTVNLQMDAPTFDLLPVNHWHPQRPCGGFDWPGTEVFSSFN